MGQHHPALPDQEMREERSKVAMQNTTTQDERILAALAHAGVVANMFNLLGIVSAALIWATQHKQSRYVGTHALQALMFQFLALVLALLLLLLWGSALLVLSLPAIFRPDLYPPSDSPLFFRLVLLAGIIILMAYMVAVSLYGLAGALAAWHGHEFGYVLVNPFIKSHTRRSEALADDESADLSERPDQPPPDDTADTADD